MFRRVRYPISVLFAIIMISFGIVLFQTQRTQHEDLIHACQRANILRRTINENNAQVVKFLNERGQQLQLQAVRNRYDSSFNLKQARTYFELASKAKKLPIIDCKKAYR